MEGLKYVVDSHLKSGFKVSCYSDVIGLPYYAEKDEETLRLLKAEAAALHTEYVRLTHEWQSRRDKPKGKTIKAAAQKYARARAIEEFSLSEYNKAHTVPDDMAALFQQAHKANGRIKEPPQQEPPQRTTVQRRPSRQQIEDAVQQLGVVMDMLKGLLNYEGLDDMGADDFSTDIAETVETTVEAVKDRPSGEAVSKRSFLDTIDYLEDDISLSEEEFQIMMAQIW